MLAVFLLPAFTRLGHECQDLLSPREGMHVCTDKTSVYTLIRKSFGGMESEPMLTPKDKSPVLKLSDSVYNYQCTTVALFLLSSPLKKKLKTYLFEKHLC